MAQNLTRGIKRGFAGAACTAALSFLAAAAVWGLALFFCGFYPFGGKSVLITDLGQQYIEFHAALYDMVTEKSGLLFTWNAGLGMSFVGLFAYYLASPFTLLIFLFPRGLITDAVLAVISAKIAVSGLTFSIYLNRGLRVKGPLNIAFSMMYALCGYSVIYFFNLMWLDAVALLPLVILALRRLITGKSSVPLVAVYALLFFSNFYTAYMVGVFSALYLIAALWIEGRAFKENIMVAAKFLKAAALAAGLTAFLTLPAAFALADSHGSLSPDHVFVGFMTDPLTLIKKMAFGAYDSVTDTGTPFIYCGALALGLAPVFFLHRGIPKREKTGCALLIGAVLVSMMFSPLDYLWHAAENPVWFPCRYSFVFVFLLLSCAARAISTSEGLSRRAVIAGFAAAAGLIILSKLAELAFPRLFDPMSYSLLITLAALAVYALLALMSASRRALAARAAALLLALAVGAELVANTCAAFNHLDRELGFEERGRYISHYQRGIEIRGAIKKADSIYNAATGGFYRVENSNARNPNDGLSAGYRAVSHYSSFSRRETFSFLKSCGMFCLSGHKIFRYYGSTSALDSILGVKYVFGMSERRAGYLQTGIYADGLPLWLNTNALPLIFFADSGVLNVRVSPSPFDTLDSLMNGLGADHDFYSPLEVRAEFENCEIEPNGVYNLIKAGEQGVVRFIISNPARQHVLLYLNNNFSDFKAVYLNGEQLNTYGERLIRGVIELSELEPGEHTVSLYVSGSKSWYSNLLAASFDSAEFEQFAASLKKDAPADFKVMSNSFFGPVIEGSVSAPRDGALFTSIPADGGWRVEVDGKRVKPQKTGNAFLVIPVLKGEHSFRLSYRPRGLVAGLSISALTFGLCIFLLIRRQTAGDF
ncbi:MAG TPA: YfhO family protein [Candidatus Avimonas sp.]|nr:YfhO family protein [Candidatus Avimonas sp.]